MQLFGVYMCSVSLKFPLKCWDRIRAEGDLPTSLLLKQCVSLLLKRLSSSENMLGQSQVTIRYEEHAEPVHGTTRVVLV